MLHWGPEFSHQLHYRFHHKLPNKGKKQIATGDVIFGGVLFLILYNKLWPLYTTMSHQKCSAVTIGGEWSVVP